MKEKDSQKTVNHNMPKKLQNPPKKFKNFDGIEYLICWKSPSKYLNASGLCDPPSFKKPKILIDPRLKERRMLSVLIEEYFHAQYFDKTEKEARKFAAILTKLIYMSGWRKKN